MNRANRHLIYVLSLCIAPLLAATTATAAAPEPDRSAERIATETCVWNAVQALLRNGRSVDDIDSRILIGRDAVDVCAAEISAWAKNSSAVREAGESIEDVELHMNMHYIARGALFSEGRARPFYEVPTTTSTFSSSDERTVRRGVRPMHAKPRSAATESDAKEENAQN